MNIGIPLSKFAYTPESFAYKKYLLDLGYHVQCDYELDPNNDINIHFMGVRPFWRPCKGRAIEVHEYQSLSTPYFARAKDYIKKSINKQPSGRIFLNQTVYNKLNFTDDTPFIYRDMGIDESLFQKASDNPIFDIIYCGSIERRGLISHILELSKNYKVAVVGYVPDSYVNKLVASNVKLIGRLERKALPDVFREARYGLNFTPNIYPYNIQTSTKTLEYLASGLGVISNRYCWSESFFESIHYRPIWLEDISENSFDNHIAFNNTEYLEQYTWPRILEKSNLSGFLNDLL